MLSCMCLYFFLLFIMLYPVPAIDSFLEVNLNLSSFFFLRIAALKDVLKVLPLDLIFMREQFQKKSEVVPVVVKFPLPAALPPLRSCVFPMTGALHWSSLSS